MIQPSIGMELVNSVSIIMYCDITEIEDQM